MSLQTSYARNTQDHVVNLASIGLAGTGHARREGPGSGSRVAGNGITLSLVHLDVALAVEAQHRDADESTDHAPRFKVYAKRLPRPPEDVEASSAAESREDPVIQRLSDALAAMEATHDRHAGICADALRLAILTRQYSGQAHLESSETVPAAVEESCGRNARSLQKWRLKRVLQYVDDNLAAKITLEDLATVAALSRMHFAAQFRAAMGMPPHQYLLKRRIERSEELLKQAEISLVEIALTVGFQTQAHFTTVFKRFTGDTPHQWRSAYLAQSIPVPAARRSLS